MQQIKTNGGIIKIVGLLGAYSGTKRLELQQKLLSGNKFTEESGSEINSKLKDQYYPEFRNIMFYKDNSRNPGAELLCRRYICSEKHDVTFVWKKEGGLRELPIAVNQCEIFLFPNQISLFSLRLSYDFGNATIDNISDLINLCRNFDAETSAESKDGRMKWHEWITEKYLVGEKLRGAHVLADEFSGSKFKVFSVFDINLDQAERDAVLYDFGTSSPPGSGKGAGHWAPHPDYLRTVMSSKVSYYNNWESLCLFDSFTTVGSGILSNIFMHKTWEFTYFRIYLFRLFFKYNLFRYNTELHDNTVKLRNQFEDFLTSYQLSHISFNFLPNELYSKIGSALHLDEELHTFQHRINRISSAIQEERQSRTNALLQFVTVLGGLSSVQPVFDGLSIAQKYLGWSDRLFYTLLVLILLGIGTGILAFLMPELVRKVKIRLFGRN